MKYALIIVLALAACTDGGDYPNLMPTEQALAEPTVPAHAAAAIADPAPLEASTTARADALKARADALRRPVVSQALIDRAGESLPQAGAIGNKM